MDHETSPFGKEAGSASAPSPFACIEPLEQRLLMRHTAWGYSALVAKQDQAVAAYPKVSGAGETIAIIDTGVDYNSPTMGGGFGRHHKVVGGWNFFDNNSNVMDNVGHGTAVATIAAGLPYTFHGRRYQGVAPDAQIVALKVDNGSDVLNPSRVTKAFQWVLDNQAKYNIVSVNISEGEMRSAKKQAGDTFANLLALCAKRGIFVAASSGNEGWSDSIEYPGYDPNVASAGSVDVFNEISSFTDTGPALDMLAPGETVAVPYLDEHKNLYFTYSEGTSFAAPFLAGTAALIHQINPTFSTKQILGVMQSTGSQVTDPDSGASFASLNIFAALSYTVRHSR